MCYLTFIAGSASPTAWYTNLTELRRCDLIFGTFPNAPNARINPTGVWSEPNRDSHDIYASSPRAPVEPQTYSHDQQYSGPSYTGDRYHTNAATGLAGQYDTALNYQIPLDRWRGMGEGSASSSAMGTEQLSSQSQGSNWGTNVSTTQHALQEPLWNTSNPTPSSYLATDRPSDRPTYFQMH